jgi:hypothetical protein
MPELSSQEYGRISFPLLANEARSGAPDSILSYGVTVMVTALLTTLPIVAVMVTVPLVVIPDTSATVPADTVARLVLLEVQVATLVTGTEPLHVDASAVRERVGRLAVSCPLEGVTRMDWMHPTVTVTVCVPVIDGFVLEVAVTVAVPVLPDVTKPEEEIVATVVGVMAQETDGLFVVLPSLLVPNAVICTVLPVVPFWMVGVGGPTEIDDSVGLTKKPVQLMVSANVASMAKVQASRSFCLSDAIVVKTPWMRLLGPKFAPPKTNSSHCYAARGSGPSLRGPPRAAVPT